MNLKEDYNKLTHEKYDKLWRDNLSANRPYIEKSIDTEINGKCCIIVGAGHSLNASFDYLRYTREKLNNSIWCVDTAIRPLVKNGIRPQAIVTIDPMKDIRHFVGAVKDTHMIAYTTSNPQVISWHKGEKTFLNNSVCEEPGTEDLLIESLPLLGSGGNVATVALAYAEYIGYKKIAFVGVDLSAPFGNSYAKGCLREGLPTSELGLGGMWLSKAWIESFLRSHTHVQLTNITRYGVKFKGAENIPV